MFLTKKSKLCTYSHISQGTIYIITNPHLLCIFLQYLFITIFLLYIFMRVFWFYLVTKNWGECKKSLIVFGCRKKWKGGEVRMKKIVGQTGKKRFNNASFWVNWKNVNTFFSSSSLSAIQSKTEASSFLSKNTF